MDNWQMFPRPRDEENKKSPILKEYIIPFGALLIAILTSLANNTLPWWGSLALDLYVAIIAIFLVVPVITPIWKNRLATSRNARLGKTFLPKTIEAFRRFKPMVDAGQGDTLWKVWQNACMTVEMQKHIRPNSPHFYAMSSWHEQMSKSIGVAKPTDFKSVTAGTASWVLQYVSFCREAYTQFENLLRDKQLDDSKLREIKQNWNHVRDEHNNAINNWISLCEEINESFGQDVCATYYETLRPLV